MRYAPKLLDLSADERWKLGFEHRVDQMANRIHAEIRGMAYKARADIFSRATESVGFIQSGVNPTFGPSRRNPSFWHLP
jgi:hypothetical protein